MDHSSALQSKQNEEAGLSKRLWDKIKAALIRKKNEPVTVFNTGVR